MSTEAATSTPAASPAAPAAPPAVVSTPAATGKQSKIAPQVKGATTTIARTYDTGGSAARSVVQAAADAARANAAPAAAATVAEAPKVAPKVAPAVAETPKVEASTPAATTETPGIELPASLEGETESAAPAETPAAATEPAITDKEIATRLGKLERREQKHAENVRAFAEEKRQHATALERVRIVEQAAANAQRDPIGFMHRAFGITPQQLADAFIGRSAGAAPATDGNPQAPDPREQRITALEQRLQEAEKQKQIDRANEQVQGYISNVVRPIVADGAKYPYLNHEFGASAAKEVYDSIAATYRKYNRTVDPKAAADFIEDHLKKKYEGAPGRAQAPKPAASSAASAPSATQRTQVGAPTASQRMAPAQAAPAAAPAEQSAFRRIKSVAKPYTSQPR